MNIDELIIHCSDTPEGRNDKAADIDRWHKQRKWRCIGYHYVIDLDGTIEGGRPETEQGAHCKGHNSHSLGICYIGGRAADNKSPKDTRTPAQKKALLQLLKHLLKKYPNATIHSHHDFDATKTCPNFDATAEYAELTNKPIN